MAGFLRGWREMMVMRQNEWVNASALPVLRTTLATPSVQGWIKPVPRADSWGLRRRVLALSG
jgi:hypothetical protein